MSIKVALFEYNRNIRNSIIFLLGKNPSFNIVGSYDSTRNCVKEVLHTKPDVVLMDIQLPWLNGIEIIKSLKQEAPQVNILIQTSVEENERIYDTIVAGASGYVLKKYLTRDLVEAIKSLYTGGAPMSPPVARRVLQLLRYRFRSDIKTECINDYNLTDREKAVLACIVNGHSYKMTGSRLNISRETVRSHIKNMYVKLRVASLTELVAKSIYYKLVNTDHDGQIYSVS